MGVPSQISDKSGCSVKRVRGGAVSAMKVLGGSKKVNVMLCPGRGRVAHASETKVFDTRRA